MAALELVTGKLELILARDPTLALAPMDIEVTTQDVLADLDAINAVVDEAENYLEDGEVQKARALIRDLGSEIVISVTNIHLPTYPAAIKAVAPLIDKGELEEAKTALQAALNTLVITESAIPLPLSRAEAMLVEAETLAEKAQRSKAENSGLNDLLDNARYQLRLGEALGYGEDKQYERLYAEMDLIEAKTADSRSRTGFFDKLKGSLAEMKRSLLGS